MTYCQYTIWGIPGSRDEETCGMPTDGGPLCRPHEYAMDDDGVDLYRELAHKG